MEAQSTERIMSGLDLTNECKVRREFVLPSAIRVKRTKENLIYSRGPLLHL